MGLHDEDTRQIDLWESFYCSTDYMSWCIVPMSTRDMLIAVAFGDAEVESRDDNEWGPDLYFRWLKSPDKRSHEYVKKPLEGCGCEAEWPEPR
ncbi:MAG: hypothetical protein GF411_08710 [Candidatus Lokiarchaeota archaeon]|nr:hypothetical protein [Candidatus Lokiarchaeota archaeon]